MYLYCTAVAGGRPTVARHVGYAAEESGSAFAGFQSPSAAVLPATKTFWPQSVVTSASNVVATLAHTGGLAGPVRAPTCSASAPPAGTVAVTWPVPSTAYAGPVQEPAAKSPFITSQYVLAG